MPLLVIAIAVLALSLSACGGGDETITTHTTETTHATTEIKPASPVIEVESPVVEVVVILPATGEAQPLPPAKGNNGLHKGHDKE